MTLTDKDVATILLQRQNANHSFILDAKTREKLGHQGFEYALNKRWIELDDSTQCMRVSQRADKMSEMTTLSFSQAGTGISIEPATPGIQEDPRELVLSHVCETRNSQNADHIIERFEKAGAAPIVESISGPDPGWRKLDIFQQGYAGRAVMEADAPMKVGDTVMVAEDGQTYQATVQAMQPDGNMVLSFGDKKPRAVKQAYTPQEVGRMAPTTPGQSPAPAAPAAQALPPKPPVASPTAPVGAPVTGGPPAPGVARR